MQIKRDDIRNSVWSESIQSDKSILSSSRCDCTEKQKSIELFLQARQSKCQFYSGVSKIETEKAAEKRKEIQKERKNRAIEAKEQQVTATGNKLC